MATVGEDVTYHAERALEAIRLAQPGGAPWVISETVGSELSNLAYDHARDAARAALNRTRKVKR